MKAKILKFCLGKNSKYYLELFTRDISLKYILFFSDLKLYILLIWDKTLQKPKTEFIRAFNFILKLLSMEGNRVYMCVTCSAVGRAQSHTSTRLDEPSLSFSEKLEAELQLWWKSGIFAIITKKALDIKYLYQIQKNPQYPKSAVIGNNYTTWTTWMTEISKVIIGHRIG